MYDLALWCSVTSTILYWLRWTQSSAQGQEEETWTPLLVQGCQGYTKEEQVAWERLLLLFLETAICPISLECHIQEGRVLVPRKCLAHSRCSHIRNFFLKNPMF